MHRRFLLVRLLILILVVLASGTPPGAARVQAVTPGQAEQAQVSPYVTARLADDPGPLPLLVVLADQADPVAVTAQVSAATGEATRVARLTAVYTALVAQAETSQAPLVAWLDAQGLPYTRHYLVNLIAVAGDATLVAALQQRSDVAAIVGDPQVAGMEIAPVSQTAWATRADTDDAPMSVATPYGLDLIGAPAVWAQGYRGQGIVVAGQDTGVDWDHVALRDRYRGWGGVTADHTYNWLDAWADIADYDPCVGANEPCDDNGHGTHTIGTLVGSDDAAIYGVAPDAKWIGCRNMLLGVGTPSSYLTCFEFLLAPYPQGGDPFHDGRPELAPHVINNSWGCPPQEGCDQDTLRAAVETLRAAGILIVASTGNLGPGCSSVRDPIGIYDASLSVAAHDAGGNLASFSSRGPVMSDGSGRLKPDLAAPGVSVLSTAPGNNYIYLSGTSMASPHVVGAAALLWSAAPALIGNPDLTEQVLLKSATLVLDADCAGDSTPVSPNPSFGHGRLNVAAAVAMARAPWQVAVQVEDSAGTPQPDAVVRLTDLRTAYGYTATTGFNGVAYLSPIFHGEYALTIMAGGNAENPPHLTLVADAGPISYEWQGSDMAVSVAAYPQVSEPRLRLLLPRIFAP